MKINSSQTWQCISSYMHILYPGHHQFYRCSQKIFNSLYLMKNLMYKLSPFHAVFVCEGNVFVQIEIAIWPPCLEHTGAQVCGFSCKRGEYISRLTAVTWSGSDLYSFVAMSMGLILECSITACLSEAFVWSVSYFGYETFNWVSIRYESFLRFLKKIANIGSKLIMCLIV